MILLLLADGFEETEALVPLDLLKRAKREVKTVGITGKTVTGAHGIPVTADLSPRDVKGKIDLLILPGGMPGAKNLDESPDVDRLIEKTVADGGRLAAICAAPMILGHRGLLKDKRAVCFPGFENELEGAFVTQSRVVTDGKITTAVGMGAAYEFGLELISLLAGLKAAENVKSSALIPESVWQPATVKFPAPTPKTETTVLLGLDDSDKPVYADIVQFPHALIGGMIGTGKTEFLRSILLDLIRQTTPDDLRLILIDPKGVEFSDLAKEPHLLVPVIEDAAQAIGALEWLKNEMVRRYGLIGEIGARDLKGYNGAVRGGAAPGKTLPRIVVVIDELYDLIEYSRDEAEDRIISLAQKARAAGIHLLIATQRPRVDVVSGALKVNIPARFGFRVAEAPDSFVIIDEFGANRLSKPGEMLFRTGVNPRLVHLTTVRPDPDAAREAVAAAERKYPLSFDEEAAEAIRQNAEAIPPEAPRKKSAETPEDPFDDPLFIEAVEYAISIGTISTAKIQRRFRIGFMRATQLMDAMERMDFVGPFDPKNGRRVLITFEEFNKKKDDRR